MKFCFLLLNILFLLLPGDIFSQDDLTDELTFEVNRVYPSFSLTREELQTAQTLIDLNRYFQTSWIREYISVEISALHQGRRQKVVSKNDFLTSEQKELMQKADVTPGVSVKVEYLPENNLKQNDPKIIDFTFSVEPENEATFAGGKPAMLQYLKDQAIDKIPTGSFTGYDLTAVKFTVGEEGQIIDVNLFWPSENEDVNQLLLETIAKMPKWKPAEHANGLKVKQEFAFTVGNMENCAVNLLNIRKPK